MSLYFKKCTAADLETLVQLSRATFIDAFEAVNKPEDFWNYVDTAFSEASIAAQLAHAHAHFYFAYINEKLAGYFKLNEADAQSDINDPDAMELERIYVSEHLQGQKIGTQLLDKAVAIARVFGVRYLWLGVWEHNQGAIRFYERYGFKKFGTHPYAIHTDIQTDWLMKLELDNSQTKL